MFWNGKNGKNIFEFWLFSAYGKPFMINVNTYDVAAAGVTGFNLVYNQIPC